MVNDALLAIRDKEEELSCVYAHAIAARAGYTTAVYDYDRDGVDLRIQAGGEMRPAIEFQLKATINLRVADDGHFRFRLKRRNYDLLRISTQTPRLLVVPDLPSDERQWMTITEDELIVRHRAYWKRLRGYEESDNQGDITVAIPQDNLFDVRSLRELMEQSRGGIIQ